MSRNSTNSLQRDEEERGMEDLISIILSITNREDLIAFLSDMLTDNEMHDIVLRYLLMDDLWKGKSQRDIAQARSMSLCRITRGSKMLKKKNGFMRKWFSHKYDESHI